MGILERLRPPPRWKHSDPRVRAAVARLDDVAALGEIARTDPDGDVRAEAVRQLTGLGAEASDEARATDVARQLIEGGRFKEVTLVVRESASAGVRAAVLELLDDQKSLGWISRHAREGATRLAALARLQDADEILNVSLKSEHTDVAVAALERVGDTEGLSAIAQRGRNKVAA